MNDTIDSILDLLPSELPPIINLQSQPNCTPPQVPSPSAPSAINTISYCYVLPSICALGLLGNTANLITLFSRRLKAVSYLYLRGLGIADMLCMLFVMVFVSFEMLNSYSPKYSDFLNSYEVVWYRAHLMLPLINWTVSAGILIIVALTLERYVSISWPMVFREWNSPRRAVAVLLGAYVVSLILYIPMCWQNEVVSAPNLNSHQTCQWNGTSFVWENNGSEAFEGGGRTIQKWIMTDNKLLLNSPSYRAYKYSRETLLKFLPIAALTFFNLRIIFVFKKVTKRKRRLSGTSSTATREQRSLLFLLAGIVVLFFFCNIPAAINLVFITEAMKRQPSYQVFRAVANLLEITNHALNFYNFCLCSSDYRMTFLRKFPCVKVVQESADQLKRRLSNSFMRVHGSRKVPVPGTGGPADAFTGTSSLRSQLNQQQLRGPDGKLLRRAISSDALLRLDHQQIGGGKANRRYRPAANTPAGSKQQKLLSAGGTEEGDRRNERRRFYASAESVQLFDVIPEKDSNQDGIDDEFDGQLDPRKISGGKRPAVSAIDFSGAHDYQALMTETTNVTTSPSVTTPFTAVSFIVPSLLINGVREEELVVNYDPNVDTLL